MLKKPTIAAKRTQSNTLLRLATAAIAVSCFGLYQPPALAVNAGELLELLKKKGVITQEEYDILIESKTPEKTPVVVKAPEPSAPAAEAPKAAAATPAPSDVVGRFSDGVLWESGDKKHSLALSGRVQFDYRNFAGADVLAANTFDIRRAYLGARGKFWDFYEFQVVGDFANLSGPTTTVCTNATCTSTASVPSGTASHLDEAYFNVAWWKQARFRFGQFDTPFSLETLMSDRFTDFQERSMGSTTLAQGKARGVMVYGVPTTGVYYGLAYTNSAGKNTNDTNNVVDSKDITGRVVVNFAELFGQKNAVYHLGGAFSTGTLPPNTAAPSGRTDGRGITFFAPAPFTGEDVDRDRYGIEAALAYGPVKLQAEYIKANFSGTSSGGTSYDRDIKSYYVNLNWLVTGEHYASAYANGLFGRLRPKQNFSPKGDGWGAFELGVHYTEWDASDFSILAVGAANPGTGALIPTSSFTPTNKAKGWTVGLKWIPNPNTRFLLNVHKTDFSTPVTVSSSSPAASATTSDEKAITLRGQFDF